MNAIAAIITTHAEGDLIRATLTSCMESVSHFKQKTGLAAQILIAMDCPSSATQKVVDEYRDVAEVHVFDFADQGLVRNAMVKEAQAEFIAFLDGDDLWSENWLINAHSAAQSYNGKCVIYPEFNWFFEGSSNILCQIDDLEPTFDIESLRVTNLWDALCFCSKDIYLKFPFSKRRIKDGFAYEDWHWNRQLVEAAVEQKIARDTIIFKRRRIGSQSSKASRRGVMAEPSNSCFYRFYQEI